MTSIVFRPHHFMCTLGFQGKGYSPKFVENFQAIHDRLHSHNGDEKIITVSEGIDDICMPCPERRQDLCRKQSKIDKLDAGHKDALQIKAEERITWGDAKQRIKTNISNETFHRICDGCEWKSLGVCEQALRKLQSP